MFATLCFTNQATAEKIKKPLSLKTFFFLRQNTLLQHLNIQVSALSVSVEQMNPFFSEKEAEAKRRL